MNMQNTKKSLPNLGDFIQISFLYGLFWIGTLAIFTIAGALLGSIFTALINFNLLTTGGFIGCFAGVIYLIKS